MSVTLALLFSLAPSASVAAIRCTILDADFQRRTTDLLSIDADTLRGRPTTANGEPLSLAVARMVTIDATPSPAIAGSGWFVLVLRDGQRIVGKPGALSNDTLLWTGRALGKRSVPLKEIDQILARPNDAAPAVVAEEPPTQDVIQLANGDAVTGVISASTEQTVTCQGSDGTPVPIEWTAVRRLRLAPAGAAPAAATGRFRVGLSDGSLVLARGVTLKGETVTVTLDSGSFDFSAAQLARIEHLAGEVRLLTNTLPTSDRYEPYFPQASGTRPRPPQGKTTIGGHESTAVIHARPRRAMSWTLDGTARAFRTRYGIPDGLTYANATVRVRLDDRVVHEQKDVAAGKLSDEIRIDLGTARTLTLEVDYGQNYDVQDELFWVEPALIAK